MSKKTITQNNLPNFWNRVTSYINDRLPKGALASKDIATIEDGGTNATTAKEARENLGITYGTEIPTETPETGSGAIYFFEDEEVDDTGWVNITPSTGTWDYFQYRKIGNMVTIRGHASAYTWDGNGGQELGYISSETAPFLSNVYIYPVVSGSRIAKGGINKNGKLFIDWVRTLSDGANYTTSTWMNINIIYFI